MFLATIYKSRSVEKEVYRLCFKASGYLKGRALSRGEGRVNLSLLALVVVVKI